MTVRMPFGSASPIDCDADEQALAGLDLDLVLLALLQAVEELDGAEHRRGRRRTRAS